VGRSLGTLVGQAVAPRIPNQRVSPDDLGYIVEAACLAHDLGNPPFGHSGEQAISDWFNDGNEHAQELLADLSEHQCLDLTRFEGNAQGFRIVTNLESRKGNGGLQLSYAVLGAFCKYPCSSRKLETTYVGCKKYGFLVTEKRYFLETAEHLSLTKLGEHAWHRHPLAFLTEAADDICYRVIDLEDGLEVNKVTLREAESFLLPIAQPEDLSYMRSLSEREQLSYLRALTIERLIKDVAGIFLDSEEQILSGDFGSDGSSLINHTQWADILKEIRDFTRERVYRSELVLPFEIAGAEALAGLLDAFCGIALELKRKNFEYEKLSVKNARMNEYFWIGLNGSSDLPSAVTKVVDYVSGMTDRFAISSYRKIKGISF
jgi:dGTPase